MKTMQVRIRILILGLLSLLVSQVVTYIVVAFKLAPLAYNTGIAFSIPFTGSLQIILSGALLLMLIVFAPSLLPIPDQSRQSRLALTALGAILGGGASNLLERIMYGYVIDYIDLRIWPSFNAADTFITTGAIALAVLWWKK